MRFLSFQAETRIHGEKTSSVDMWRVPALCEAQYCVLTSKTFIPVSLCSGIIWQTVCNTHTKSDYVMWKSDRRLKGIRTMDGGLGVVCSTHCLGPMSSSRMWQSQDVLNKWGSQDSELCVLSVPTRGGIWEATLVGSEWKKRSVQQKTVNGYCKHPWGLSLTLVNGRIWMKGWPDLVYFGLVL